MKRRYVITSALAPAFLAGFGVTNDAYAPWYFAVADRDGNRKVFGPYSEKKHCIEARNTEARK